MGRGFLLGIITASLAVTTPAGARPVSGSIALGLRGLAGMNLGTGPGAPADTTTTPDQPGATDPATGGVDSATGYPAGVGPDGTPYGVGLPPGDAYSPVPPGDGYSPLPPGGQGVSPIDRGAPTVLGKPSAPPRAEPLDLEKWKPATESFGHLALPESLPREAPPAPKVVDVRLPMTLAPRTATPNKERSTAPLLVVMPESPARAPSAVTLTSESPAIPAAPEAPAIAAKQIERDRSLAAREDRQLGLIRSFGVPGEEGPKPEPVLTDVRTGPRLAAVGNLFLFGGNAESQATPPKPARAALAGKKVPEDALPLKASFAPGGKNELRAAVGRSFRRLLARSRKPRPAPTTVAGTERREPLEDLFALPAPLLAGLPFLSETSLERVSDETVGGRVLAATAAAALVLGTLQGLLLYGFTLARRRKRSRSQARAGRAALATAGIALAFLTVATPARAGEAAVLSVAEATLVGGSEGFGGGDLFGATLGATRARVREAIGQLRDGLGREAFCRPRDCAEAGDSISCALLSRLTDAQVSACRAFLLDRTTDWLQALEPSRTPFRVSTVPLAVPDESGARTVLAVTRREDRGPVVFHAGSISALSPGALAALVTHELGHKISVDGRYVDDEKAYGAFPSGRELLDAVGAAVLLHVSRHAAPPQAAPPIAVELHERACARAGDPELHFALGLAVDLEGSLPPEARAELRAASDERSRAALALARLIGSGARERAVRRAFSRFLAREPDTKELSFFLERLGQGTSLDAAVASLFSHPDYARRRAADAPDAFVGAVYRDLAGRAPDAKELASGLDRLRRSSRATVASFLMLSDPGVHAVLARDWYRELVNREPTKDETDRVDGRLRAGAGWVAVQADILSSREYAALQSTRWRDCPAAPARDERVAAGARRGDAR